jgi:hypothetical protein
MTQFSNEQELFHVVFSALEKQGFIKSVVPVQVDVMWDIDPSYIQCKYRGANDCRCAAGHVLPDAEYKEEFEALAVTGVKYFMDNFSENLIWFLRELQRAHDFAKSPADMKQRLIETAKEHYVKVEKYI